MVNFSCFKRNCYLHITVFKESESEPTKKLGSGTKAKKLCTGSAKVKDIFIPSQANRHFTTIGDVVAHWGDVVAHS